MRLNKLRTPQNELKLTPLKSLAPIKRQSLPTIKHISEIQLLRLSQELLYHARFDCEDGIYNWSDNITVNRIKSAQKLTKDASGANYDYAIQDVRAICKALKIKNPLKN